MLASLKIAEIAAISGLFVDAGVAWASTPTPMIPASTPLSTIAEPWPPRTLSPCSLERSVLECNIFSVHHDIYITSDGGSRHRGCVQTCRHPVTSVVPWMGDDRCRRCLLLSAPLREEKTKTVSFSVGCLVAPDV